jgi:hypothetical protein
VRKASIKGYLDDYQNGWCLQVQTYSHSDFIFLPQIQARLRLEAPVITCTQTEISRVTHCSLVDSVCKIRLRLANVDFQPPTSLIELSSTCLRLFYLDFRAMAQV